MAPYVKVLTSTLQNINFRSNRSLKTKQIFCSLNPAGESESVAEIK